jgi:signal transduction histidine kinase
MKKYGHGLIKIKLSTVNLPNCLCSVCLTPIEGEFIELSVSDSGLGIEKETISHIFDPFFTTKGVGEGTGLGLSIVSGIVHHSRGHILIDSEINVGTTFRLLFPTQILWRRATDRLPRNVPDNLNVHHLNRRATDRLLIESEK